MEEINEKETEKDNKGGLSRELYEISILRRDFDDLENRIAEKFLSLKEEITSLKASINRQGAKLQGYTMKELVMLKQLGIQPKDILSGAVSIVNEKTQEKAQGINRNVSEM
jgi:hypothetical protein